MTAGKTRVLVVEDSLTVRRRICDVLSADEGLVVIAEAEDGRRAIELCQELRPDVVTMDMMLPGLTGLAATEYIMAYCPTPILIVSSSLNRGELFRTYDALAAGAVDGLDKPLGDEPEGDWERRLVAAVKLVARIRVITHPRARLRSVTRPTEAPPIIIEGGDREHDVVAIGASTGGPGALAEILRALPADYPIPVLIVLHLGEPFGTALAEWLDGQSRLAISYATEGEPIRGRRGVALLAPPGAHLSVRGGRAHLTADPPRHSCRPSVDVLFESVAREHGPHAAGFLLTGMGKDGAKGLLEMRHAGSLTVAQDERTSVVYGMPREAVLIGAAERQLPLDAIVAMIASLKTAET